MTHASTRHSGGTVGGDPVNRSRIVDTIVGAFERCEGGATVDPSGAPVAQDYGYVVALAGHECPIVGDSPRLRAAVIKYVDTVAPILTQRAGRYVGGWADGSGYLILDVVEILSDRDEALTVGRARGQTAIFDLSSGTEVYC